MQYKNYNNRTPTERKEPRMPTARKEPDPEISSGVKKECSDILDELDRASDPRADRLARVKLRICLRSAAEQNVSLSLSNDVSPLGKRMAQANRCSRARGWL